MPLQALQRQVIFSQQLQKSLRIFNCYWRWFQRLVFDDDPPFLNVQSWVGSLWTFLRDLLEKFIPLHVDLTTDVRSEGKIDVRQRPF